MIQYELRGLAGTCYATIWRRGSHVTRSIYFQRDATELLSSIVILASQLCCSHAAHSRRILGPCIAQGCILEATSDFLSLNSCCGIARPASKMPSEEIDKVPEDIPSTQGDVEMEETDNPVQIVEPEKPEDSSERAPPAPMDASEDVDTEADPVEEEERKSFANHLKSPIVTLIVGKDEPAVLQAHQAFLVRSPYFEDICGAFAEDGGVRLSLPTMRRLGNHAKRNPPLASRNRAPRRRR